MNSPDNSVGLRLRELRIRRGLTQKELSGDRITRNMLSLIESGSASPSVSTLLYLSERLGVPVGYFFSDGSESGEFMKYTVLTELKARFAEGAFRDCRRICAELPPPAQDDEISMILAHSCFRIAEEEAAAYRLRDASALLDAAAEAASRSVYCSDPFAQSVIYARALFEAAATDRIAPVLCSPDAVGGLIPCRIAVYFASLNSVKNGGAPVFPLPKGEHAERHISALVALGGDRPRDGVKKLRELSLDASLPYYMQYRVLGDLENAANAEGDLSLAYSSARRRLELIDRIRF